MNSGRNRVEGQGGRVREAREREKGGSQMKITRRQFLKASGALAGYLLTGPSLQGGLMPAAYARNAPQSGTVTQRSPEELLRDTAVFAVGGTLASWPSGRRLARVLYRAPGATRWEVKSW